MALLTEEQMYDLRETIQNNDGSILYCINMWNEKQTAIHFEPNWSRAPKSAVGASVSVTWVNETGYNTLGYTLANYIITFYYIPKIPFIDFSCFFNS